MSTFKSPQLHVCGRLLSVLDLQKPEQSSFYIKCNIVAGEEWQLLSGNQKFETFQSQTIIDCKTCPIQQPFNLHFIGKSLRGWPRLLAQVWKVDQYGRHNLYGYGTLAVPFKSGQYNKLTINCWRPMGSWYDRFIGANSEMQYPGVIASSLNRYGLRTFTSCQVNVEINVIGRGWQLHGISRQ